MKFDEKVYEMARVLDSRKAEDILLIDVKGVTIIADAFVIASGRSTTHVKTLADELEEAMAKAGVQKLRMEGYQEGRWIVLDYGEILVHLFHKDEREYYGIERLWKGADNAEEFPVSYTHLDVYKRQGWLLATWAVSAIL